MRPAKPTSITDILEIVLEKQVWNKIRAAARQKKTSYSWMVRLCLFHLLQSHPGWNATLEEENARLKEVFRQKNLEKHRHALCLYGDDALLLRLWAGKWRITMSRLVGLAVALCLEEVLASEEDLVRRGTKICQTINLPGIALDFRIRQCRMQPFPPESFRPHRPISPRP